MANTVTLFQAVGGFSNLDFGVVRVLLATHWVDGAGGGVAEVEEGVHQAEGGVLYLGAEPEALKERSRKSERRRGGVKDSGSEQTFFHIVRQFRQDSFPAPVSSGYTRTGASVVHAASVQESGARFLCIPREFEQRGP
jgi:shikimate kinase